MGNEAFLALACLQYDGKDGPERWRRAAELASAEPALTRRDLYHAAAAGEVAVVESLLGDRPNLASELGGALGWPALLYACYSRFPGAASGTARVIELLLDRGADPSSEVLLGGHYHFTALTGVCGEGESGPFRQPRHEHWLELAELLLDRGASVEDGQAVYNRMLHAGDDDPLLALLLSRGLNLSARMNWVSAGDANDVPLLVYRLHYAVRFGQERVVERLLRAGVDPNAQDAQGRSAFTQALLTGRFDLADLLREKGAVDQDLNADDAALVKVLSGESESYTGSPRALYSVLCHLAGHGPSQTLARVVQLGKEILNAPMPATPLHQAAWNGNLENIRLLLDLGADPSIKDRDHNATPQEWAAFGGQREADRLLSSHNGGLLGSSEASS